MISETEMAVEFTRKNQEIVRSTYRDDNQDWGYKGVDEAAIQR